MMIIVGDINIPTNQERHPDTVLFKETLDGLNLRNQIDFATDHFDNSLDAVITIQENSYSLHWHKVISSLTTTGYILTSPTVPIHTR